VHVVQARHVRLASVCPQECHMVLPAHALGTKDVRLNAASNEGHFILMIETGIRPYLAYNCSGITEYMVLPAHARQGVQVRMNSVSKVGHFTHEA
jgi:hypothetical protein